MVSGDFAGTAEITSVQLSSVVLARAYRIPFRTDPSDPLTPTTMARHGPTSYTQQYGSAWWDIGTAFATYPVHSGSVAVFPG